MNWVLPVAQWGVFALFALCVGQAFVAWRVAPDGKEGRGDGGQSLGVLLSCALYAWLFEDLNVRRGGGRGAYSYNSDFSFFVDQIPLFIVLAWAVILWTAMRLTDAAIAAQRAPHEYSCDGDSAFHTTTSATPCAPPSETASDSSASRDAANGNATNGEAPSGAARWRLPDMARRVAGDAALAVLLDLSFDATAIRHRFWFWHGVGFDQAWFGVPAGNFFGWLLVSLCFSGLTRALRELAVKEAWQRCFQESRLARGAHFLAQMIGVPLVAFAFYRALESGVDFVLLHLGANSDRASLIAFFVVFSLVLFAARAPRSRPRFRSSIKTSSANATSANATSANATSGVFRAGARHGARGVLGDFEFWVRASFHAFAIFGLLMLPATRLLAMQRPALLGIAGLVCFLDGLSGWWMGFNRRA